MNLSTYIAINYNGIYMKASWLFDGIGWVQKLLCRHERQYRRRSGWYCLKCNKNGI